MRIFAFTLLCLLPVPALACWTDAYGDPLKQDWPQADKETWYETSQGSRLIPMPWYQAIRLPDGARFDSPEVQGRYATHLCPDTGRPMGFVVDRDVAAGDALGLNCAACHTAVLDDGNQRFVVDGAPSDLDLQSYMRDLFGAMLALYRDGGPQPGPVWTGFARDVLGDDHRASEALDLQQDVLAWLERFNKVQQSIEAGRDWGHGRTDAVAVILNTAASLSDTRAGTLLPAASAPVSFPHVWNAPQMRRVQWNGSAWKLLDIGLVKSIEMGAVVRNVAEVLGVFAEVRLTSEAMDDWGSYPNVTSSIRMANLVRLERSLATLKSPAWPQAWGDPQADPALFDHGAALYAENCASCHSLMDRDDLQTVIEDASTATQGPVTRMVPLFDLRDPQGAGLQTDPMMACNALTHTTWAGAFGELDDSFGAFRKLSKGALPQAVSLQKFAPDVTTLRLIEELALRLIFEKRGELADLQKEDLQAEARAMADSFAQALWGPPDTTGVDPQNSDFTPTPGTHGATSVPQARALCAELLRKAGAVPEYKARPLNGIWATAPFLHNGSVPSLADLLLPPDQRPREFTTGAVRFDPDRVGLGAPLGQGPVSRFRSHDDDGQAIPGNDNGGHDMPASVACFTDPQGQTCAGDRAALLTYLKSL
ncbi:di-heme-cytochrome C peroxidase [Tropicibacter oceani]|uniref:Di-heme-cytochrome C peroxidase n=1 Tax=Tropicibacter oceani TaxID=3058420 RepID=A0ABY8QIM2_9RHOB|nr:di-heme-cytochrome C peroxidase [Tropicibacter oceani]WGW04484.1 di-heme-cytochrome C peroxidase [Tropicibacter oceani]